jgi:hypothetical protein
MSASVTQNLGKHAITGGPGRPPGIIEAKARGYSHKEFVNALIRNEFVVVDEMCALYRDPNTPARTKYEICKEFLSYLYPKRKQVEVKGDIEHRNLNVTWNVDGPSSQPSMIVDEPSDPA